MTRAKRRFRIKMRPGRSLVSFSSEPETEPPGSAGAREEVVVSEQVAAFSVRHRAAEIVDVIDAADEDS